MRLSINKTLIITAFLVLLSVATITSITFFQSRKLKDSARAVSHTESILRHLQKIVATALDSETGARGYLLTGNQKFLEPLLVSENNFRNELKLLQSLLKDNKPLARQFDSLGYYVNQRIEYSTKMVKTKNELGTQAAVALVESGLGKFYTDKIRGIGGEMEENASNLLLAKQKANNDSIQQLNTILYTILLMVVLLGLYFLFYIKNNIEKRRKVQRELEMLNKQIEDAHDAIFMISSDLKIIRWNRGAELLYGFTKTEAYGRNSNELLQTAITDEEIDSALKIIHEKDHWTGELSRVKKNGEVIYVRSSTTTVRNNKGLITGYVSVSYDITDQKKLIAEIDHLATLVEHSSDAIISRGLDHRILSWNEGAEQLFGYTKEEAIGKTASELQLFSVAAEELEAFEKLLVITGTGKAEVQYFHRNKTSFTGSVTFNSITNEQGETTSYAIIIRDISHEKKSEEQLKKINEELEQKVKARTDEILQTETRFRNTLDNMLEAVQIIGFDMHYIYVNEAASKQGKYTREQMIGQPVLELYPGFEQTELYKHFQKCMVGRQAIQIEQEFEFPDKTKNWFELSLQPVPEGIVILSVDITDRKQAEVKRTLFTSIVNSSDDAIFTTSFDDIVMSWNPGAETIFGYTAQEIIGEHMRKLLPAHLQAEENELWGKIKAGEYIHRLETQRLHKNGTLITLSLSSSPLRDEYNAIIGISTIARDITQENEIKKRIVQSEENLKTIFENTSEGFVLLDTNGLVKAFNKTAEQNIFNNSHTNLAVGKSIFELVEPERELFFASVISRVLQGETIHYDRPYTQNNGTLSWIDYTYTPVFKSNHITGICITGRDTTEKKIAEYNIKTSNERYETVAKATSDAIWDYDFDTGKTFISGSGYQQLFGYHIMNDYSEEGYWESHIHPDDKKRVLTELAETLADKNKVQSASEYRFLKADGTYAYINDRFFIIRENGKPKRMLGAKQDISEMKMAEQRLKTSLLEKQSLAQRLSAIINTLPANIALLDKNGLVMDVNDAWRNFAGENGFIGKDYGIGADYIAAAENASSDDEHDAMLVAMGLRAVLAGKEDEFVFEYSCHSAAELRWFRMVVAPLKEKEYAGAVVMHIDISEQKRFEQERLQMEMDEQKKITRAMLQGQEKERNAIGEELHDNVNQILVSSNLILSMAKIKQEKTDELIGQAMNSIKEAIDENRKIAHFFVAPDLHTHTLAEQLNKLFETMIEAAGMKAYFHVEDFNEEYLGNEHKIHIYRIAQEQCTNIIKHSKATSVHITLSTSEHIFTMHITDDGVGMNTDQKIDGIGIRNIKGRLGLFNGKATVTTAPGKGFTLEISFDLAITSHTLAMHADLP